jgi:hypothetical protein
MAETNAFLELANHFLREERQCEKKLNDLLFEEKQPGASREEMKKEMGRCLGEGKEYCDKAVRHFRLADYEPGVVEAEKVYAEIKKSVPAEGEYWK